MMPSCSNYKEDEYDEDHNILNTNLGGKDRSEQHFSRQCCHFRSIMNEILCITTMTVLRRLSNILYHVSKSWRNDVFFSWFRIR
jgi:hypothetical protein